MIKLEVEDYCQNCSNFIPDVDRTILHAGYEEINETTVFCKNSRICENMYNYLKEEIRNDKD